MLYASALQYFGFCSIPADLEIHYSISWGGKGECDGKRQMRERRKHTHHSFTTNWFYHDIKRSEQRRSIEKTAPS